MTFEALKIPNWDLNKGTYEETDRLPLMESPGPVCMILAGYLLFVLKLGPSFMRKRKPYQLKGVMMMYNLVQIFASIYLAQRYLRHILEWGLAPSKCYMNDDTVRGEILVGIYLYFTAKVTELLDTVFFVLRKKDNQITFLHLYHHSTMMIATWIILKYSPTHLLIFTGLMNSSVHVVMYTYYGLAALGPKIAKYLWWKKYMTVFQLIQFVSIFIQYLVSLKVSECPPSKGIATFYASNCLFFLVLFLNFYRQSYNKKKCIKNKTEDVIFTSNDEKLE